MYVSFKYGTFEGVRNGRYYTDLNEDSFRTLILSTPFKIIDMSISTDVRPERDEKWLNVVIKK